VLSKKKPTAGSSQIKNADASRIDLSTDDHDEKLLSFFAWQPLLGIAEIHYIYYIFLCESIVFVRPWNRITAPILIKKHHIMW
jgi:hypothetical protein